jgi:hypothetical protein
MIVLEVSIVRCESAFAGLGVPDATAWSTSLILNLQIFLCLPKLMGWRAVDSYVTFPTPDAGLSSKSGNFLRRKSDGRSTTKNI